MLHAKIIDVTKEKIDIVNAQKFIASSKCGASIYFVGTVRDQNNDKKVTGITYDSHDALVIKSFEEIYKEAETKSVMDETANLPNHLADALNKDYSSVMKAVEEKAKFKNGA